MIGVLAPLLGGQVAPSSALAARRSAVAGESGSGPLEEERRALLGNNEAAAVAAAKKLGTHKSAAAEEVLLEVLASGTSPAVAEAALTALGAQTDERAWDTLALYAGHRSPALRRQALRSLAQLKGASTAPRTSELLVMALGDADQDVRATAAEALAARNDRAGLGRMMSLLRDNEPGVAEPLGALVTPALVPELAELLGTVNEDILANTLGAALKRKDLAEQLRVDLVRTLAKISSPMSTAALAEYAGSATGKGEKTEKDKAKKEAQAVLDQRSSSR